MSTAVAATLVDDIYAEPAVAGAFLPPILDALSGLFHCICPCGCGAYRALPIYTGKKPSYVSWSWNGNVEKPTLSPSIRDVSGCKYHGHLTDGVWTFCADSGR